MRQEGNIGPPEDILEYQEGLLRMLLDEYENGFHYVSDGVHKRYKQPEEQWDSLRVALRVLRDIIYIRHERLHEKYCK